MLRRYVIEAIIILLHDNTRLHIATLLFFNSKLYLGNLTIGLDVQLQQIHINVELGPCYIMHLNIEYK